jgi:carboxypeptidase PM20D1
MTPAERLSLLIACRTVSADPDPREFARLRGLLGDLYPRAHDALTREELDNGSLLYTWRGAARERPLLLMAHHDVVPAPAEGWTRDPFGGEINEGAVHGRGALDDKGPLVCMFEAVEGLLAEGLTPAHDVLLFTGSDEETVGDGAKAAAALLGQRGVKPWLVSDEGGGIVEPGMLPGTADTAVAAVAVAEKGTVDVRIAALSPGGHSSMPQPNGATERLAEAVVRISRHVPEVVLPEAVSRMIASRAPHLPASLAQAVSGDAQNTAHVLAGLGPELEAMTRTTMVVTRLSGSPGDNVLATRAEANVNVRLVPGDTIAALLARLATLLADLDIEVVSVSGDDPSPTAPSAGEPWELLERAVRAVDPELAVVPYLQSGSTDSRYFTDLAPAVYRFAPLVMTAAQRRSIHGIDEHVSIAALEAGTAFHRTLIRDHH